MICTLLIILFLAIQVNVFIVSGVSGDMGIEMEMESETSRRLLWAATDPEKRYISYAALRRDVVPCARPGAPYYNCRAVLPHANIYSRGCGIITHCARDMNP